MTRHFADLGFTWGAYSDTTDLEDASTRNFAHHSYNFAEMIVNRRFPVIKRRTFVTPRWNHLRHHDGSSVPETLAHIQHRYTYDLNLVYDHLLRTQDMADLKDVLNLDFVLPTGGPAPEPAAPTGRAVVAALITRLESPALARLLALPPGLDLVIATDSTAKQTEIKRRLAAQTDRRANVLLLESSPGQPLHIWPVLAPFVLNHTYLCFLHDQPPGKLEFPTVATQALERQWTNLLGDGSYAQRVLSIFEAHPRLGLLAPPAPYHGSFFRPEPSPDGSCAGLLEQWAGRMNLRLPPRKGRPSLLHGSSFWCRTAALKPLLDQSAPRLDADAAMDAPAVARAVDRMLPLVAQSRGFFTGWVMTDRQAAADLTNLNFMLNHTKQALAGTPSIRWDGFAGFRLSLANLRKLLNWPGMRGSLRGLGRLRNLLEHQGPDFIRRWATRYFNRPPHRTG